MALLAIIVSFRSQAAARAKELALEETREANEEKRAQRDSAFTLAMAQNQTSLQDVVTKQISDNNNFSRQLMGLTADHNSELHARTEVAKAQAAIEAAKAAAWERQASATENLIMVIRDEMVANNASLQKAFTETVKQVGDQMRARGEATDTQLSGIKANTEYANAALDTAHKRLGALTTHAEQGLSDHQHLQETVEIIMQRLDAMPGNVTNAIKPLVEELRREIKAIAATMPPPREFALAPAESTPLNERAGSAV